MSWNPSSWTVTRKKVALHSGGRKTPKIECNDREESTIRNAARLRQEDLDYVFALMYEHADKTRQDAFMTPKDVTRRRPKECGCLVIIAQGRNKNSPCFPLPPCKRKSRSTTFSPLEGTRSMNSSYCLRPISRNSDMCGNFVNSSSPVRTHESDQGGGKKRCSPPFELHRSQRKPPGLRFL